MNEEQVNQLLLKIKPGMPSAWTRQEVYKACLAVRDAERSRGAKVCESLVYEHNKRDPDEAFATERLKRAASRIRSGA